MRHAAIIDCTALIYFSALRKHFNIFEGLQNLFIRLHIPGKVFNEFYEGLEIDIDRNYIINRVQPENNFFRLCTHYDSISLALLSGYKGIDAGEAEAVAQRLKVNATYIISDDVNFTKAMTQYDKTVKVLNSLHILSILDINKYITDYNKVIRELYHIRPFTSSQLRNAYREAANMYSIPLPKKLLSTKCSLKSILK